MPAELGMIALQINETDVNSSGVKYRFQAEEAVVTGNPTSTDSAILFKVTPAYPALELGPALKAFGERFSEEELAESRARIAAQRLEEGLAPTLADLRLAAGLSQSELANRIGKTQTNLSLYERGRTDPGFSVVRKLSNELGVSLDQIAQAIDKAKDQA